MRVMTLFSVGLLAVGAPAASAGAQVRLNEIYASHTGTDDQEFVELIGPGGMSLDDFAVLVIEGDSTSAGFIDRVWDLTGMTIPLDGYFVLGDTAVTAKDFDLGASNTIENGTETFLLIQNLAAWVNTSVDIDSDNDGLVDMGFENPGTIMDLIGMVDTGFEDPDWLYYGAGPIGPDGSFFPPGIFRAFDYPNAWDANNFLDFDDVANIALPRTPGAMNIPEPATLAVSGLGLVRCRR